ncbi:MAG: NfeD family protein [Cyanobacteria bacterium P01_F01_bin.150]
MNNALIAVDQQATICRILRDGWEWQVRFQGTYWTARAADAAARFHINDRVYVVGRENLILLIQPLT